ncbi:MAG: hypothetical protein LBC98_03250 [Prevotellaceae bacterium]|jgi:hypothetical protein|nr:hypothetical protein [Prevotellaceae bacterium]
MKQFILKTMLYAVAVLALTVNFAACKKDKPNEGNDGSFEHGGHKYLIVKEKKTWTNAAADAVNRGGYLAEIGSAAEQTAVYAAIVKNVSSTYTQAPDGGGVAYVWIGATDKDQEGSWFWNGANGSSTNLFWQTGAGAGNSAYSNWGAGEPDNFTDDEVSPNGQDYAAIGLEAWPKGNGSLGSAGQWNDISGSNLLYYVVEIEAE